MAFVAPAPLQAPRTALRPTHTTPTTRPAPARASPARRGAPAAVLRLPKPQPPNSSAPKGALPSHSNYRAGHDRVVLFDGECVLCNRGVDALLQLDERGDLKLAALQSAPGRELAAAFGVPSDLSTVVFVDRGVAHIRSDAILRLAAVLPNPVISAAAAAALVVVPRALRDFVYTDVVARNRYWMFGSTSECRLMQPGEERRFIM